MRTAIVAFIVGAAFIIAPKPAQALGGGYTKQPCPKGYKWQRMSTTFWVRGKCFAVKGASRKA